MKTILSFLIICALILPVGFSFNSMYEYVEGTADTINGALETVKGIMGNDKYNSEPPQDNSVSPDTKILGATGESVNVREWVDWKLKKTINIYNEDMLTIKDISGTLYDVHIRPKGGILKRKYTAIRMTVVFEYTQEGYHIEQDCLWIGPYAFNNETGEEYPLQTDLSDNSIGTALYIYESDNCLIPVFNALDFIDVSKLQYLNKYPKSITEIKQTFDDFWQEWTGG